MTNPHQHDARPPSPAAVRVVRSWPTEDWISTEALADHLATVGALPNGRRTLQSVLNEARRRSWLIRDQRADPVMWQRTPSGQTFAQVNRATEAPV